MKELVVAKMVLAAAGIAVFFTGARAGSGVLRWVGIALVAIAFFLRFVGRDRDRAGAVDAADGATPRS